MSLDLDAIEQRALWEASEDRRIAGLMRQRRNRVTLEQRADAVEALVAEVKRLREDNAALVASRGDDWQTGYDAGCACDCLDNFRECHRVAEWATLIRCNACRRAARNLLCGWHHAYFFVDHSPAFCRSCGADDPPYTPLEAVRL